MNILILTNHFNAGGISSYIINLSRGLIARGDKVFVGSSGGEWLSRLSDGDIEHIWLPLRTKSILSPKLIFAYFILRKVIKEKQIEVIHANTHVTGALAYFVSLKQNIPFVTTAHGFYKPSWQRRKFGFWGKKVIAISEQVRGHLLRDFKIPGEKTRLVHNGIDIKYSPFAIQLQNNGMASGDKEGLRVKGQGLREKFGLKDGPVVGIIARLSEVKGHKYLISAMKEVIKEIPNAQMLSIGGGKTAKDLQAQVKELGLKEAVHFIDGLSDTKEAFGAMDVFVMPSLQEGLGLSIMEAMAAGVPVVASSVGGIPSLIENNRTGLLVEPAKPEKIAGAIIELLRNKEKSGQLAVRAREFITREFSLEKMAEETQKIYKECV